MPHPLLPLADALSFSSGEPKNVNEDRASEILKEEDLEIRIDLGLRDETATYWTCDLPHEYISINADYRS
ncbi:hypothetical protein JCM10207_005825 [Rhodosporidiobolus poonsookiae]